MTDLQTNDHMLTLSSSALTLTIDLATGIMGLHDQLMDTDLFRDASFRIDGTDRGQDWASADTDITWQPGDIGVTVTWTPKAGYDPIRSLHLQLDGNCLTFDWHIENPHDHPLRVQVIDLLHGARFAPDSMLHTAQHLKMGAGAEPNPVEAGWSVDADNGAMLTWLDGGRRRCLVAGGLAYRNFARRLTIHELRKTGLPTLNLSCYDPHGVTIPAHGTLDGGDTAYLALGSDPFVELERFGQALAEANDAAPNNYDFPTLCGWMTSTKAYGEGRNMNTSAGLVEQARIAHERGLTNYTPVAIRLEPDTYCYNVQGNTEQGWWDDQHWAAFGHLVEPYPTMQSFCDALKQFHAIAFTYFQSCQPSKDFSKAHPDWLIGKDISRLHQQHRHQYPPVQYDYTAKGFREHCLSTWQRLRDQGMRGIKFDYPESAWIANGGFEDTHASTTAAYRAMFELCRQGLGDEAFIHERNLGGPAHGNTPRLDATAGIVDLQRVWGDASHFEPEMASRIGLRWYKSRRVFYYYPDGKRFVRDAKPLPTGERRAFLTLIAFLSGRLELGTAFDTLDDQMLWDITRLFPMLPGRRSPRPVDMLLNKPHPQVYHLNVADGFEQVLLVNNDDSSRQRVGTRIGGDPISEGGLGLGNDATYHAHEFWNQTYLGKLTGQDVLACQLDAGHVAIIALRRAVDHPQLIGTNRHLYQGLLEADIQWDSQRHALCGQLQGVVDDPVTLTIASNGAGRPTCECDALGDDVYRVILEPTTTGPCTVEVPFV